jgi:lipid-binding SYLF domain-containing protein
VVFVFHEEDVLRRFIDSGWDFGGDAAAAAQKDETGAAVGGNVSVERSMSIYQITDDGLALTGTLGGTKYWKDDDLNQ